MSSASHAVRAIAVASRRLPRSAACPKMPSWGSLGVSAAALSLVSTTSLVGERHVVGCAPLQSAEEPSSSCHAVRRLVCMLERSSATWPAMLPASSSCCVQMPRYMSISPESRK